MISAFVSGGGIKKMNFLEKFLLKKYAGTQLTFDFAGLPIDQKAMCIGSCIKINGSKFWAGNVLDNMSKYVTGKDWHLYIRTSYDGSSINKRKLIDKDKAIQSIPGISTTIGGFYSINIDELLVNADIFIQDMSQERNGKPLGKNYIHFKGKEKDKKDFEGYLTFSDIAVESGFKKYISYIYNELN